MIKILQGDVIDKLRELPDKSVHMVVTSPPYWNLRNYCVDGQIGMESTVEEYVQRLVDVFSEIHRVLRDDGTVWLNLGDSYASGKGTCYNPGGGDDSIETESGKKDAGVYPLNKGNVSTLKGSGLKPKDLVGVPWRVALALQNEGWWLRSDIIWFKSNCMPSSVSDRCTSSHEYLFMLAKSGKSTYWTHRDKDGTRIKPEPDYRYLDLLDGVEYTEEPEGFDTKIKIKCPKCDGKGEVFDSWFGGEVECDFCEATGKVKRWKRINLWEGHDYFFDQDAIREPHTGLEDLARRKTLDNKGDLGGVRKDLGRSREEYYHPNGRNKRDVWWISPQPFPGAHFAVFPEGLVEPCIKAGTSEKGCCPKCGAPWSRIVERGEPLEEWKKACGADSKGEYKGQSEKYLKQDALGKQTYSGFNARYKQQNASDVKRRILEGMKERTSTWRPTCGCNAEPTPCTVLDVFGGSGTTGLVARNLSRDAVLIELNPEYVKMAKKRLRLYEQLPFG